jgi:hypothetical protein
MANIPLRGMVRQRVLDIFAGMYKAGGAEFALSAQAGAGEGHDAHAAPSSIVERIALWYVTRKQRRQG